MPHPARRKSGKKKDIFLRQYIKSCSLGIGDNLVNNILPLGITATIIIFNSKFFLVYFLGLQTSVGQLESPKRGMRSPLILVSANFHKIISVRPRIKPPPARFMIFVANSQELHTLLCQHNKSAPQLNEDG